MKWAAIRSALVKRIQDEDFELPVLWESKEGRSGVAHLRFWFMPASTAPSTTGPTGRDLAEGIAQIDVMYPPGDGVGNALEKADEIAAGFKAGLRLEYDGQDVIVRGSEISPAMNEDGWLMVAVSVRWSAYIRRSL